MQPKDQDQKPAQEAEPQKDLLSMIMQLAGQVDPSEIK